MLAPHNDENPTNTIDVGVLHMVTHGMRGQLRLKM